MPFTEGQAKIGGRKKGTPNKKTADVKGLAQSFGPAAIKKLKAVMDGKNTPKAVVVSAARELLDRGYGKPIVPIAHVDPDGRGLDFPTLPPLELVRRVAFLFSSAEQDQTKLDKILLEEKVTVQ